MTAQMGGERHMKLGRKNLLYSMALAGILMLLLIGYFICMLPSLYVNHVMEQNLKSIREQHKAYMETGSYEGVGVRNVTACFSLEIPREGNLILVTGKAFSAEIQVRDQGLAEILDRCRVKLETNGYSSREKAETDPLNVQAGEGQAGSVWEGKKTDFAMAVGKISGRADKFGLAEEMEELAEMLKDSIGNNSAFPVEIRLLPTGGAEGEFFNESVRVHSYSEGFVIIESCIEDAHNRFANYMALEKTENSLVISVLPVVAPDVNEIRPVVLGSLPMLGAVIVLLVLLFSQMYSGGIVSPILRLVRHTREMEQVKDSAVKPLAEEWPNRKDEVRELADTLDDFYMQIRESYRKLEEKNRELKEENRRQEVFLRASSHQLKTPIAAALLLVEGMINEIGRYKETKIYLPKVKEQLLSMRRMVEDILYLNRYSGDGRLLRVEVGRLLEERLRSCQVELAERRISVELYGQEEFAVCADEVMIVQILDNLLSNAVKYTPEKGAVRIFLESCNGDGKPEIRIENSGVTIPEDLLPHVFEPFVRGSHENNAASDSHGLGLYIASFYAKKLGVALSVRNEGNCVVSSVIFPSEISIFGVQ